MSTIQVDWPVVAAAFSVGLALVIAVLLYLRRRRSLGYLLRRISWEQLQDVVIPDDVDGEIHLDLALLTERGILVLEIRRASGTLFWGDQLERWTVLDGVRRKVLDNPLPGMRARRHAVHALTPRVPVDSRVLLVGDIEISGDRPPGVVLPRDLVVEFPMRGKQRPPAPLREAWDALKAAARPI